MINTPNYNLNKFQDTDKFNKDYINENFDIVDQAISDLQDTFNNSATGGALTTKEVVDARKGKETLREKIDVIDEQLNKIDKIDIPKINSDLAEIKKLQYVSYFDLGAIGDGVVDDTEAIYNTHIWANDNGVPVRNQNGTFKLNTTKKIPVKTNCYLYGTKFIINEAKNVYFEIMSYKPKTILDKTLFVNKFKKNINFISELKNYNNSFLYFEDDTIRTGKRYGTAQDFALQDFVVVGDGGKVSTIIHDIVNPTFIECYPFDDNNLEYNGATFDFICDGDIVKQYGIGGVLITRSNVTMNDVITNPKHNQLNSSGSIYFGKCANIVFNRCNFTPRVPSVSNSGTYGIGGEKAINITFNNCDGDSTSIAGGSTNYWGVMGTNLIKDMNLINCRFNRVDCHFQAYNITIDNSSIGNRGITVCGGGLLKVTNTKITSMDLLVLRNDYGARWNGDIIFDNIDWTPFTDDDISILNSIPSGDGSFNYGYDIMIGSENISFSNIKLFQLFSGSKTIPLIRTFNNDVFNGSYYLAKNIKFKNIDIINRKNLRGFVFSNNTQLYKFKSKISHSFNGINNFTTNVNIIIDNVLMHDFKQSNPWSTDGLQTIGNFIIDKTIQDNIYTDPYQICTNLIIRNCENVIIKNRGLRGNLKINDSSIIALDSYGYKLNTLSNISNYTSVINSIFIPTLSEGAYGSIDNRPCLFMSGELINVTLKPLFTSEFKNDLSPYKYLIDGTNRNVGVLDIFKITTNNVIINDFDLSLLSLLDTNIKEVLKDNNISKYSRLYGTTQNRQHNGIVPYWYFDTTVSKPVCWNGASWFVPN